MNACKRESIWRRGLPLLAACIHCGMHSLKIRKEEKMRRHLTLYLLALSMVLGLGASALAQDRTFTTIEPPGSNGTNTFAIDINSRGLIVGAYVGTDGRNHGYLRSKEGEFTTIDFPGAVFTRSAGINDQGDIVGMYRLATEGPLVRHGYLRNSEGEFTTIDPPGSFRTQALGINARGDIVGRYCTFEGCRARPIRDHGFLLRDGVFTTIDVPGAVSTSAWKINSAGQIVGGYEDTARKSHVFLLSNDELTTIDFPGAVDTAPDQDNGGINPDGDIVAYYCDDAACANLHGFRWSEGEFTSFDFPGAVQTFAFGVNARQGIVGGYTDASNNTRGFLLHREEETNIRK